MPSKEVNRRAQRKWYAANKELHQERMRKWRADNPGHELNYVRERRKVDPVFKLKNNLRVRLRQALKQNYKRGSAVKDLGCSIEQFRVYLESKFQLGMTWDNYGEWHIDHILPLASFDLQVEDQLKKALHFTNLQPLWKKQNLSKGSKLDIIRA